MKKIVYFSALLFVNCISAMDSNWDIYPSFWEQPKVYTADELREYSTYSTDTIRVEHNGDTINVDVTYDDELGSLKWRDASGRTMVRDDCTGRLMYQDEQCWETLEQQEFRERREWLGGSFYNWPLEKEERYQRWQLEQEQQEFWERLERLGGSFYNWPLERLGGSFYNWPLEKEERYQQWQLEQEGWYQRWQLEQEQQEFREWLERPERPEWEQHELGENDCVCEVY
jgi:hypothetical protein